MFQNPLIFQQPQDGMRYLQAKTVPPSGLRKLYLAILARQITPEELAVSPKAPSFLHHIENSDVHSAAHQEGDIDSVAIEEPGC